MTLTKPQRKALHKVSQRAGTTYRNLRKLVQPGFDCIMVPFAGMWLGIEKDGHTHS
jgi:hypothetical protein